MGHREQIVANAQRNVLGMLQWDPFRGLPPQSGQGSAMIHHDKRSTRLRDRNGQSSVRGVSPHIIEPAVQKLPGYLTSVLPRRKAQMALGCGDLRLGIQGKDQAESK